MKKRRKFEEPSGGNFWGSPKRFEVPFLSIAEELLKALKEDLIEELIFISAFRERRDGHVPYSFRGKKEKFKKTFGHFPQTKCEIYMQTKTKEETRYSPRRCNWIKTNHHDFDIFIDDSPEIISEAIEKFKKQEKEKIFVFPDYKTTRHIQFPNLYHVKTTVSNIEDKDFSVATLESTKKNGELSKLELILIGGIVILMVIIIIGLVVNSRKKKLKPSL